MPAEKTPYDGFGSKEDIKAIRDPLKKQVEGAGLTYDHTEFKKAEPKVRVALGARWMGTLRAKLPVEKQGKDDTEFQNKIFGRL